MTLVYYNFLSSLSGKHSMNFWSSSISDYYTLLTINQWKNHNLNKGMGFHLTSSENIIYIYLLRDSLFFNLDLKVVCSTVEKANEGHSQRSKCKTSQPCSVTIEAACEGVWVWVCNMELLWVMKEHLNCCFFVCLFLVLRRPCPICVPLAQSSCHFNTFWKQRVIHVVERHWGLNRTPQMGQGLVLMSSDPDDTDWRETEIQHLRWHVAWAQR